uniref:Uncharacterized protein n=1 Tax=Chromera velia CCMP2878 TaxID=1169474 RepID=A0A0G4HBN7_9ALVE|eukprot:Cvel_26026.t1-p1 / transcript=Cvel_26026.t1 / gene=Cvel_26026 / organism=Chromera_velia_CCMP2878 / gene_product=hypothetical protein / transcript_product=hypothetical protein / location=Cvel_scaffold3031:14028-15722(-) / protein_length=509 / sequence_SO=supercontig / SO=protein_coding / is_pseudo=false
MSPSNRPKDTPHRLWCLEFPPDCSAALSSELRALIKKNKVQKAIFVGAAGKAVLQRKSPCLAPCVKNLFSQQLFAVLQVISEQEFREKLEKIKEQRQDVEMNPEESAESQMKQTESASTANYYSKPVVTGLKDLCKGSFPPSGRDKRICTEDQSRFEARQVAAASSSVIIEQPLSNPPASRQELQERAREKLERETAFEMEVKEFLLNEIFGPADALQVPIYLWTTKKGPEVEGEEGESQRWADITFTGSGALVLLRKQLSLVFAGHCTDLPPEDGAMYRVSAFCLPVSPLMGGPTGSDSRVPQFNFEFPCAPGQKTGGQIRVGRAVDSAEAVDEVPGMRYVFIVFSATAAFMKDPSCPLRALSPYGIQKPQHVYCDVALFDLERVDAELQRRGWYLSLRPFALKPREVVTDDVVLAGRVTQNAPIAFGLTTRVNLQRGGQSWVERKRSLREGVLCFNPAAKYRSRQQFLTGQVAADQRHPANAPAIESQHEVFSAMSVLSAKKGDSGS